VSRWTITPRPHATAALALLAVLLAAAPARARPADPVRQPLPRCTIVGTNGDDVLRGTRGADVICARAGDDVVRGGSGDDIVFGGPGDDRLAGGRGDDDLRGLAGADRLDGGPGADRLQGGLGPDVLSGGAGRDLADYGVRRLAVRVTLGAGRSDDGLDGEGDDVRGNVEAVRGGDGGDRLRGNGGPDRLSGGPGDDRLGGGRGDDRLGGGGGRDRLDGDAGDDRLDGGAAADRVSGGRGADLADYGSRTARVDVSLGSGADDGAPGERDNVRADVERVRGGAGGDTLTGDRGDNVLEGRGGDDRLDGGPGDDRLSGGDGDDRLDGRDASRFTDDLRCGRGDDRALADAPDRVAPDCENGAPNAPPTALALTGDTVPENAPAGTEVGTLRATDPDAADQHVFTLVPGDGGADNAAFTIAGDRLRTAATFDFEGKRTYAVRVRADDGRGGTVEQAFTIGVTDVNEAPTAISLSNAELAENQGPGAVVGTLAAIDPDTGQGHDFALVAGDGGTDNGAFRIAGATLETARVLDFEAQPTYSIRVRATDRGSPPLSVERVFTITVTDTPDPPAAGPASAATDEDAPVVITLSATDPEGDDPLSFAPGTPAHGTLGAVGPVSCDHDVPDTCTAVVTYTPFADYNGEDSFTYIASDGAQDSPAATVALTVRPVNDAPVTNGAALTTDEDAALTVDLGGFVSDVETTSDENLIYVVTQPAHGSLSGSGPTRVYTPDADYHGPDSFTYTVTDRGDPDACTGAPCAPPESTGPTTVTLSVEPANDQPQAGDAARSVNEDGSLDLDLATLVSDVETADADLAYALVDQPAHGTLTRAGGVVTYVPARDYNGPDSFTYTVTDRGDPDNCSGASPACAAPATSRTATVTLSVEPVNDAPVTLVPAAPLPAVVATDTPIAGIEVTDVDAGDADIRLALAVAHGTLTVSTAVVGGVSDLQVTGSGTATVTITAPLAAIRTTLAAPAGLVYRSADGFAGDDTLTVDTSDLGNTGAGGPLTDTDTVTLRVAPPNRAPVAAAQSVAADEDAATTITLSASDADGDDPLSFATGTPAHGTLGPVGAVTCDHGTPDVCTANVTYTPAPDYSGPDAFTFTASDGRDTSEPATVSITVAAVNDAPVLANIETAALAYTENGPATPVTTTTTVGDPDSPDLAGGALTVDFAAGGTPDDRLEVAAVGQIAVSGSDVTFAGTAIGSFTGGTGTTPLVVTLTAGATPEAAQALVRAVAYRNVSDAPTTTARSVRFVLTDGDGGTSAPATRALDVTAVRDAPVLAGIEGTPLTYTENDPATPLTATLTVTDPDSPLTGATVTLAPVLPEDELAFTAQPGISGSYANGVLTLTGDAPAADYQTALRSVRYRTTSEDPSTAPRTATFQVSDAGGPSNEVARTITVTAVNDPPVADDESFAGAIGNTTLVGNDPDDGPPAPSGAKKTIGADILAGDTDVENDALTVVPVTNQPTDDGGRVTIEADGDFVYTPAAGTSCSDTSDFFDYRVTDGTDTDTGRVNITIAACVWYVSNNAAGNSGTSDAPFDTLAQAEAASGSGQTVFVFDGDNSATGYGGDGYAMNAGERLIGEAAGLQVGADVLLPPNPGARPTLTAGNADVISLDDGNEVRGLELDPSGSGGGITGGSGDTGGGTIDDVRIIDAGTAGTRPGLELDSTTGTFNISGLVVDNRATGVRLNNAGTVVFAPASQISITSAGAPGLVASGTALGTSAFDNVTVTGSAGGGLSLTNTTGTISLGDLDLTTTAGTAPAFALSNAGTVTVAAAGTDNVSATGGPAVDVTGTSGVALAFDSVSSTSSANDGINLANLGGGTFSATGGTIAGAAGIAFDLDGGSGDVTYPGALANGPGQTAEVTNRSGGAVTLSGPITDSADAGGGISLAGDSSGSTTFSNATKTLNTGASTAIAMTGSDGHTLTLSGGGLDVDATSGDGLAAANSGTLVVSGAGNTIDTTTGRALAVAATDIGAAGVTFRSLSANGAPSGIVLNDTGAAGGLTVSGSGSTTAGGDNSGGVIQNTTSHGVSLTATQSPSLTNLDVHDTSGSGINGTRVTDFTFDNGRIERSGTGGTADDSNISFNDSITSTNVSGALTVTDSVLNTALHHGVDVQNGTGTVSDANISRNSFTSAASVTASLGTAVRLIGVGGTAAGANFTRATLADNVITNFNAGGGFTLQDTSGEGGPAVTMGVFGSATDKISVTGNRMDGGTLGVGNQPDRFVTAALNGAGQANLDISNNGTVANPITHIDGLPVEVSNFGPGRLSTVVANNRIVSNNAVGAAGIGIGCDADSFTSTTDDGTLTSTISGNTISGNDGPDIYALARGSSCTHVTRIIGNTLAAPATTNAARAGIRVDSGSASGDTTMCLEISGNTTAGSTNSATGSRSPGINLRKQGTDPAINAFGIEGLSPSPAGSPTVENFVNAGNSSASGTFGTGGTALLSATSGFTSCVAP
jgi:Bacterial Ig domain/RTX calcium-binding nonapeptide repeat (4 copies)/Cadherin domain